MKTRKTANKDISNKSGSALVLVICLSLILLLAIGTMLTMSSQQAFTVSRYSRSATALSIAEAGIADMLKKLALDFNTYKQAAITNNFNDGCYIVTSTTNGQTGAILRSTATYLGVTKRTAVETLGVWQTIWDTNMFGTFGILSEGLVDCNGQGVLKGSVYAGDNIEIAPGTTVEGDAYAVGEIKDQGDIQGSVNPGAAPQDVPYLDVNYYRNLAQNCGGVYINHSLLPPNAIDYDTGDPANIGEDAYIGNAPLKLIFVEGDVLIKNGGIITGCIAATGDIDMQGGNVIHNGFIDPLSGKQLPSLMSFGGSVEVRAGQELYGMIYAVGDVMLNGGDIVHGGIICHGIVDARADWTVHRGGYEVPPGVMPGKEGNVYNVRIGAWLE
ncbi:MAG: hypothetical protein JXN60_07145 [Lentisphaerae bacterium]|nr:hypothetical protein [Lentisphaerota bacterium]